MADPLAAVRHRRGTPVSAGGVVLPLAGGARSLGVMTVYGSDVVRIDEQRLSRAKTTADQVTMTLLAGQETVDETDATTAAAALPQDGETPEVVVYYRAEIHQASGMIMAQLNCTIDEAMARLRAYPFALDVLLQDVARQVVERKLRFDTDGK
ncbi:MAG: ANTAR domain-containing protein [Jatrophihabitans sp.]|uniref:ANTAR domain-containing protein n=1 Tax=Jatrophihabitans sp. TaxID=1932789 RepID=UPI0039137826